VNECESPIPIAVTCSGPHPLSHCPIVPLSHWIPTSPQGTGAGTGAPECQRECERNWMDIKPSVHDMCTVTLRSG
jgi:hypothetical protein